jgi:signal transduction histidine kinase/DNA-binding response OmpR family regulator
MQWTRQWADLRLQTKCLLLISFPAAATVLTFAIVNFVNARTAALGDEVAQTQRAVIEIERLRVADSEVSADARAYFITSDETFAAQTRTRLAAFDIARGELARLTAGVAVEQQRLGRIETLQKGREEQMFGDMARFRSGILSRDRLRSELISVERERSRIQDLLQSIEQDQYRRREDLLAGMRSLQARRNALMGLCLVLGLSIGIVATLLFARGITGRIARLQRNVARLAAGEVTESLPGLDEIGAVNQGLTAVAEILRRRGVALDNALHGIAEIDADGHYLWLNKVFAEMAGCSQIHKPADIVTTVHPEDRLWIEEAITKMRMAGRAEIAARLDKPSGPGTEVSITLLSTGADPGSSYYVFLRDIWAGKKADAALVRAKDAAEASNRAKSEFLAKISHDIRTPLNAILGSADLLSQTSLSFDQSEYVKMFQRNCRRLVALINDFLDFSRIEAGAVRLERAPCRVREIVQDAVATFQETASRKGVALGVEVDPAAPDWVLGDALRIQQILVNLLSNALKFTDAGRVDVNVRVLSQATLSGKLLFEVFDTGPGIRMEDQDKIFARFVQLPNQSNGQRGAGLGLAICRDLVELMGGEIGVVSREGSGSTFHFSLPLEAVDPVSPEPATGKPGPAELSSSEPISIMVAEDTEDNRILLEHYLREAPVRLRFAHNGLQALEAVQQGEQFDLILMDIDMPEMDGLTATKKIRAFQEAQSAGGPLTPIVALSADAMQEAVEASAQAGCVLHVAKPVDRETLLKTIQRFARSRGSQIAEVARAVPVSAQVMALVPQYLASKEREIDQARASLASCDFGPIRRFGHNLKGTGRGYGFPPIEEMGKELERAAIEADTGRISSQLEALHRFVSESAAALTHS